jgi:hypothetical protein
MVIFVINQCARFWLIIKIDMRINSRLKKLGGVNKRDCQSQLKNNAFELAKENKNVMGQALQNCALYR